jgi:hypothetical protein
MGFMLATLPLGAKSLLTSALLTRRGMRHVRGTINNMVEKKYGGYISIALLEHSRQHSRAIRYLAILQHANRFWRICYDVINTAWYSANDTVSLGAVPFR